MLIASCGHEVDYLEETVQLRIMDFSIDYYNGGFSRAVSIGEYCKDCAKKYSSWGIVLKTDDDERKWLSGLTPYRALESMAKEMNL